MPVVKRSISFDADLIEEIEQLAAEQTGGNLSALVGQALEQRLKSRRLREALDDWEREFGPIPQELVDEAEREWEALWPD
jgi:metal-responsive CopG/Arc/MetJ family transcriptional regulator